MTTITVLNGERTIGGTQVVVEDGGTRLLFDCGLAFDPAGDPFRFVRRRPDRYLVDLMSLGLAPRIPGLYTPRFLDDVPAVPREPIAVALSHAHLDHTHLVGYVDPEVPIYATPPTARILEVFSAIGSLSAPLCRPIEQAQPGQSIEVGNMRLTLIPVDHDICGACGMLIETSDGTIAYSGDLRLHGSDPGATLAFAQTARSAGAKALILEGTRLWPVDPGAPPSPPLRERVEDDAVPEVMRALRANPEKLGVILMSPENGVRIEAMAAAAQAEGRLYMMDVEGLALAYAALGRPISSPHGVYVPGLIRDRMQAGEQLPPQLARVLAQAPVTLSTGDIAAQPGSFLMRLAFDYFVDLLELVPAAGQGIIFTSNASPLGPFDPAWVHLQWWAERLGIEVADAASTGHAAPRDLALIAALSGAPTVISLHSRHPELMPVPPERLLLPERGRPYNLSELAAS